MSNERKLDLSKSLMELAEEGWTLQEVLEAIGLQPVAKQEPEDHEMPEKEELTKRITGILQEIGVPAHIKGYQYLRDAIQRAVENGKTINTVTKTLYLAVAREYQTTPLQGGKDHPPRYRGCMEPWQCGNFGELLWLHG